MGLWSVTNEKLAAVGGGSGIGAALAAALASRGCQVLISGRRQSALEQVASDFANISVCVGDVTDAAHQCELVARLAEMTAPRAIFHEADYFQTKIPNK